MEWHEYFRNYDYSYLKTPTDATEVTYERKLLYLFSY